MNNVTNNPQYGRSIIGRKVINRDRVNIKGYVLIFLKIPQDITRHYFIDGFE